MGPTRLQPFGQLSQAEPNIFLRRDSRWLRHAAKQQQETNQKYGFVRQGPVLCASAMVLHIGAWYCDGDSGRQLTAARN